MQSLIQHISTQIFSCLKGSVISLNQVALGTPKLIWTCCFSTFEILNTQPLWILIQGWEQDQESHYIQPSNLSSALVVCQENCALCHHAPHSRIYILQCQQGRLQCLKLGFENDAGGFLKPSQVISILRTLRKLVMAIVSKQPKILLSPECMLDWGINFQHCPFLGGRYL